MFEVCNISYYCEIMFFFFFHLFDLMFYNPLLFFRRDIGHKNLLSNYTFQSCAPFGDSPVLRTTPPIWSWRFLFLWYDNSFLTIGYKLVFFIVVQFTFRLNGAKRNIFNIVQLRLDNVTTCDAFELAMAITYLRTRQYLISLCRSNYCWSLWIAV